MDASIISAIFVGVGSVVASILASIIAFRKSKNTILAEQNKLKAEKSLLNLEYEATLQSTKAKDAKARSKLAQEEYDYIVAKWQSLYSIVESKVDKLAHDHLQCEVKLASITTELHEIRAKLKRLETQNAGQSYESAPD